MGATAAPVGYLRPGLRDKFEERAVDAPSGRRRLEKRRPCRERVVAGVRGFRSTSLSRRVIRRMLFFRKDREDVYSEGERLMKDRRVRDVGEGREEGEERRRRETRETKMVAV